MRILFAQIKFIRMKLQNRIELLQQLKEYLASNDAAWEEAKARAGMVNGWFTPEFINLSVNNIITQMLDKNKLLQWAQHYHLDDHISPKKVGIVMAGNIPLVGFHDFLCVFVSGHSQLIKLSSKDNVLLKYLVQKMYSWNDELQKLVSFADMLKGCDAYIATGSNNSAMYFDQYFAKYPSIIRRNRTSVALLSGSESPADLENLSHDIHQFFGLGCRNVTKLYVPQEYNFVPLLQSFHQYRYFSDHHKYRNNYDYNLSLLLMNNRFYMTNETTLLVENEALFSPIAQVNYSFYDSEQQTMEQLKNNPGVQCIAGSQIAFGKAQSPALTDYADGVDIMQFLLSL
jgi:hypothetical protein